MSDAALDQGKDREKEKIKIKSGKKMREIMTAYYLDAMTARENGKKVAWITSGGPVEPLIAMDIIPIYPENHGAMLGASKMGEEFCVKAEEMGYSSDLCSYARADISCAVFKGGPIGGLPEPDMLICCNNICGTVMKWYEVQARHFNVPLFILDTPICHTEYSPEIARYVRAQMDEYINFLGTEAPLPSPILGACHGCVMRSHDICRFDNSSLLYCKTRDHSQRYPGR